MSGLSSRPRYKTFLDPRIRGLRGPNPGPGARGAVGPAVQGREGQGFERYLLDRARPRSRFARTVLDHVQEPLLERGGQGMTTRLRAWAWRDLRARRRACSSRRRSAAASLSGILMTRSMHVRTVQFDFPDFGVELLRVLGLLSLDHLPLGVGGVPGEQLGGAGGAFAVEGGSVHEETWPQHVGALDTVAHGQLAGCPPHSRAQLSPRSPGTGSARAARCRRASVLAKGAHACHPCRASGTCPRRRCAQHQRATSRSRSAQSCDATAFHHDGLVGQHAITVARDHCYLDESRGRWWLHGMGSHPWTSPLPAAPRAAPGQRRRMPSHLRQLSGAALAARGASRKFLIYAFGRSFAWRTHSERGCPPVNRPTVRRYYARRRLEPVERDGLFVLLVSRRIFGPRAGGHRTPASLQERVR
jgi:hypothetical protein